MVYNVKGMTKTTFVGMFIQHSMKLNVYSSSTVINNK